MRSALATVLFCAAALCACSKAQEQQGLTDWQNAPPLLAGVDEGEVPVDAGSPGATGAAAPAALPPAAAPGTRPIRKAGLWATTSDTGRGPQTSQICVTDDTESRRGVFSSNSNRGASCEPKISKGANGSWTATVSCTRDYGETSSKTSQTETLTGDLATRYQIKGKTTTTGGNNPGTRDINSSGLYKGACPAGMKGGDMITSSGEKRNIFDQQQNRGSYGGYSGGGGGGDRGSYGGGGDRGSYGGGDGQRSSNGQRGGGSDGQRSSTGQRSGGSDGQRSGGGDTQRNGTGQRSGGADTQRSGANDGRRAGDDGRRSGGQ